MDWREWWDNYRQLPTTLVYTMLVYTKLVIFLLWANVTFEVSATYRWRTVPPSTVQSDTLLLNVTSPLHVLERRRTTASARYPDWLETFFFYSWTWLVHDYLPHRNACRIVEQHTCYHYYHMRWLSSGWYPHTFSQLLLISYEHHHLVELNQLLSTKSVQVSPAWQLNPAGLCRSQHRRQELSTDTGWYGIPHAMHREDIQYL